MNAEVVESVASLHLIRSSDALIDRCAELLSGCEVKRFSVLCENAEGRIDVLFSTEDALYRIKTLERDEDIALYRSATDATFEAADARSLRVADLAVSGVLPLRAEGERFGAVLIHDSAAEADRETLLLICNHFGEALFAAQLAEEMLRRHRQDAEKLSTVIETADVLRELDLDTVLSKLMLMAISTVSAEVGCISLSRAGKLNRELDWGLPASEAQSFSLGDGRNVMTTVIDSGRDLVLCEDDEQAAQLLSTVPGAVANLLALPLSVKTEPVGALLVLNAASHQASDIDLLRTVVDLSSQAIENAILHERSLEQERLAEQLRIAGEIQQTLLPQDPPEVAGLEFAAWNEPCDDSGGDYYDVIAAGQSKVGFSVGDATGHGIGAALMITTARALLRALIGIEDDLSRLMTRMNSLTETDFADDRFITLALAVYDSATRELSYIGAGHDPPPVIYRAASRDTEVLDSHGLPLGMLPGMDYEAPARIQLAKGDIFLMLTDGVHETANSAGELFGKERIDEIIRSCAARSPAALIQEIRSAALEFRGDANQADDLTLLCIKAID